jgi:hypothetical protein
LLSPLERRGRGPDSRTPAAWRQVVGAVMAGIGIALLAMWGFGGAPMPWLDAGAFALVIGGAALSGLILTPRTR